MAWGQQEPLEEVAEVAWDQRPQLLELALSEMPHEQAARILICQLVQQVASLSLELALVDGEGPWRLQHPHRALSVSLPFL